MTPSCDLPPNPFSRQPIRTRKRLAGRSEQLERIEYYLHLTAAGDSPHLALIGSRGAGKTSLLNVAAEIAQGERLLVVRIDLDEGKTSAPGVFWKEFYASLLLACGEAALWGGPTGSVYTALFQMIHARRLSEPDEMVLQFPVALATAEASLDEIHCSDALIVRDIGVTLAEARRSGYQGLVALIDEADCLGRNIELIQVCRNVFQRIQGCSLVLAGTEAVFPTLTEVFSPIPRQFYRIDVRPFEAWWRTLELIRGGLESLPDEPQKRCRPELPVARELHELCGGEPSELQLYCHHMYRLVESGAAPRMALTPEVFRAVLREYRSFTPEGLDKVLRLIEGLPENLLCGRRLLRRHRLSVTENADAQRLRVELEKGSPLDEETTAAITTDLARAYGDLFSLGVTEGPESLALIGGAFTRGFWKAFVEADKGKRWSWDDRDFGAVLIGQVAASIWDATKPDVKSLFPRPADSDLLLCDADPMDGVDRLRHGDIPKAAPFWHILEDVVSAARRADADVVTEILVDACARGREGRIFGYWLGPSKEEQVSAAWERWRTSRGAVLAAHGITVTARAPRSFRVPSDEEMDEILYIQNVLPDGGSRPSLGQQAVDAFISGDHEGAARRFAWMVNARPHDLARGNYAYCLMILGRLAEAQQQFQCMRFSKKDEAWPLWTHNRGALASLMGNRSAAIQYLRESLETLKTLAEEERSVVCMLVLYDGGRRASSRTDIPFEAALLVNLHTLGWDSVAIEADLATRWPGQYQMWLGWTANAGQ